MDVKDFIKDERVKSKLNIIEKPTLDDKFENIVNPKSENYAEVGGAFNYLFSFWIAKERGKTDVMRKPHQKCIKCIRENHTRYIPIMDTVIKESEEAVETLVKKGRITDKLFTRSLDLARIGAVAEVNNSRAHGLLERVGKHPLSDIEDLRNLYSIIPAQELRPIANVNVKKKLQPWNLFESVFADAIINGTLIDIKTTKNPTLPRSLFDKLLIQSILANEVGTTVNNISIYYSRQSMVISKELPNFSNIGLSPKDVKNIAQSLPN